ncbi:MAG: hypothetical protein HOD92_08405, partial [Deltaproteobacteria bacterium]|nr:hypothetical protein [Deltaproteobacteria bacterium]
MTDILLFNQYFTSTQKDPDIITVSNRPINLLHLATYLNHKGMDCKIFELGIINEKDIIVQKSRVRCGLSDKKITEIIKQNKPKIIGIGCMYSRHYIDVIAIAKLIKKVDSLIQVVVGGNHATSFYDKVLMDKSIDFVVIGEGEITFHELCSEIGSKKNNFKAIKGIAFRGNNGEIIKTTDRELIANLDDLPMIDNSLVDTKKYAQQSYKSPFLMRYPSIAIMSSRGCPGKCIYCTVKSVWGRTWRGKSPERTVDEIESLQKE